jgi:8-oxo-dGTP diphosphatase
MTNNYDADKKQFIIVKSLIVDDGKILLVRRKREWHKEAHDKWEFPGGKIDFGELPEQTAVREAKEESGYDVEVLSLIPKVLSYQWNHEQNKISQMILICYVCKLLGGEALLGDHGVSEIRWFTFKEALQLECLPGIHEFIQEYLKK